MYPQRFLRIEERMPKPINVTLSIEEREALESLRRSRTSGNHAERAHYVLLAEQGISAGQIGKQLTRNPHTIRCWIKRYLSRGIPGLCDIKGTGRPNHLRKGAKKLLPKLLEDSPKNYGYQQAGWQLNLLIEQLSKKLGNISEKTVVRALHELGWVYKRFSKTLPADAPTKEEKIIRINEINNTIKQERSKGDCEILFCDESHFSNEPYVQRGWFKRGEKKTSAYKQKEKK